MSIISRNSSIFFLSIFFLFVLVIVYLDVVAIPGRKNNIKDVTIFLGEMKPIDNHDSFQKRKNKIFFLLSCINESRRILTFLCY